ncbi:family 2 encapsulin nanocompartment cargo protein terpene cyclase [Kitasatospora viridis]|uniref:Terpene synthase n=1 Tax=Kitasatospora viridis TaxID=281105 RepID=A0A561UBZ9_9ACTN|nr:family 2 encapsulin nanocompartment cargo protein terpene cyclase [Kitasatospora viridis]TWF96876.1 2-methylisoborneol synthase [Kitasatospora viridis]
MTVTTIPTGPTGLGTSSIRPRSASGTTSTGAASTGNQEQPVRPIPSLYHHPVPEPEPALVAEVDRRTKEWAVHEVDLYPPEWEDDFEAFGTGRSVCLAYPEAGGLDHLEAAAKLLVAENAVDDCYCEDHGGSPHGLGSRLLMAHSALERPYAVVPYEQQWQDQLQSEPPCRAYQSAMQAFDALTADQIRNREIHDLARLHLGYLAEAAWSIDEVVPTVPEYLMTRQYNSFRPCLTIVDAIGGYVLPADLHDHPKMQQVFALAALASTLVNDIYSYTKELRTPRPHVNLPTVLRHHEGLSEEAAYFKAIEIHNDVMHRFESESASCAAELPNPLTVRFLRDVAAWVDGNHWWHATNTRRYTLPGFVPAE